MNYLLTDEQKDLQKLARDFAEKELRPIVAEYDRKGEFPVQVYKKAVELGLTSLSIPTSLGGAGLDTVTEQVVGEQISIVDTGFGCAMGGGKLGLKPVMIAGTEKQQREMADLLLGGGMAAFALTEPEAGSDAGAIRTVATKVGDEYILNGRKCFITNAKYADVIIVFASVDRSLGVKGITAFIVDAKTPGLSIGKEEDKMGIRLSNTADVILEDVKVPAANMIGKEGVGFKIAMETLNMGRAAAAMGPVAIGQAGLEYATKYAQVRKTFGKPIIANQGISFKLAEIAMKVEAGRSLAYYAARLVDAHSPYAPKVGAMAKCFCSDMGVEVISEVLQVFGGYGYMRDYPIEKLYRDAKIFQIFEGANEIQKMVISRALTQEYKA